MKKTICFLMTLVLSLIVQGCFAEGSDPDFSNLEVRVTVSTPPDGLGKVELKDTSLALTSTDDAENEDENYTVTTASGIVLKLKAAGMPYLVLTQSYYASLDVYRKFENDEDAVEMIDSLISDDIHYLIWDVNDYFNYILVRTLGSDSLTKHVQDLSTLKDSEIKAVAKSIAKYKRLDKYTLCIYNGTVWIKLTDYNLLTIKGGEYLNVWYSPKGTTMTEDDNADIDDFMNVLTVEGEIIFGRMVTRAVPIYS